MSAASPGPVIGIVVPVFGHSRLVAEALASVTEQQFAGTISTVVVIDGDRDPETTRTVRAFQRGGANPIAAIFQKNARLPAARNTGIRYLRAQHPELDAIYFLDADNRLAPRSIEAFWQCLVRNPEAAWAYPDIGFFGLSWSASGIDYRETAPEYSVLRHLMGNICEAGSLVRAEVFRDGFGYDEAFKFGYEDWEFWLQCLGRGLRGVRATDSGFQYRRRPNSMLGDADRMSEVIRDKIFDKHRALFSRDNIWEQYCRECAPFLYLPRPDAPTLLSGDGRVLSEGAAGLEQLIARAGFSVHWSYLPRFIVLPLPGADGPPRPRMETTLQVLATRGAEQGDIADAELGLVQEGSERARFRLVDVDDLLTENGRASEASLQPVIAALRRIGRPTSRPADRRYAGPAAFQIDGFVRSWCERDAAVVAEAQPAAPAKAKVARRPLVQVVDPLARFANSPFAGEMPRSAIVVSRERLPAPGRLDIGWMQYRGIVHPYVTAIALGPAAKGSRRTRFCLLVEDYRMLLHAPELKELADHVIYAATANMQDKEMQAVCASEHALAAILCQDDAGMSLRALGVPLRKIIAPGDFRQFLKDHAS
jgi:glycosyltransferase involved in cell wall biosynthesis